MEVVSGKWHVPARGDVAAAPGPRPALGDHCGHVGLGDDPRNRRALTTPCGTAVDLDGGLAPQLTAEPLTTQFIVVSLHHGGVFLGNQISCLKPPQCQI